ASIRSSGFPAQSGFRWRRTRSCPGIIALARCSRKVGGFETRPRPLRHLVSDPQSDEGPDAAEQDPGIGEEAPAPQPGNESSDRRADANSEPDRQAGAHGASSFRALATIAALAPPARGRDESGERVESATRA